MCLVSALSRSRPDVTVLSPTCGTADWSDLVDHYHLIGLHIEGGGGLPCYMDTGDFLPMGGVSLICWISNCPQLGTK